MLLVKHGKGMLSSVEQAFVGRDEKRGPLKMPAFEAKIFLDWRFFELGAGELIFAIRADWFFLLEINFCDFQKYPVPSIDIIFVFIEYVQ